MSLLEMTPSLAWTSKQCASFCYTQSEMGSDEVTGPWAFWPHNSAFYWQGCALLWHQEMTESGKSRFSLLGLNPWGWALEECCLFPDTHLLTLCLCFQAGIMWTTFYHHTLLDHDLLSPRVQNSNIIYPLPWTEMTEIISQNKDFLLFSCLFFFAFYHSNRKMTTERVESEDRFFFVYKWCSRKRFSFFIFVSFYYLKPISKVHNLFVPGNRTVK